MYVQGIFHVLDTPCCSACLKGFELGLGNPVLTCLIIVFDLPMSVFVNWEYWNTPKSLVGFKRFTFFFLIKSILGICNQCWFSGEDASYPSFSPAQCLLLKRWELSSGHHGHRPKKTVLTGLIAVVFKIPLLHTKPSVTHRWFILVCRYGLCCHWKCKSCFGRSIVSFHQVIVRIVKFFRWIVS